MATFTEFYTTLLGFVNFKLYHSLNLFYPPKVSHQLRLSIYSFTKNAYTPVSVVCVKLSFIVVKKCISLSLISWTAQHWIWKTMRKTMPWPRKATSRWVFSPFTQIGKASLIAFVEKMRTFFKKKSSLFVWLCRSCQLSVPVWPVSSLLLRRRRLNLTSSLLRG